MNATPELDELDDYVTAAKYLMTKALTTGDGKMLRAIKTLMDAKTNARLAREERNT